MQDVIKACFVMAVIVAMTFAAVLYATSPAVWYAGKHVRSCNGSENCGCYEKLKAAAMDRGTHCNSTSEN